MSQFLVINSDSDCSPQLSPRPSEVEEKFSSLGVGWYPGSESSASLIKGEEGLEDNNFNKVVSDKEQFRSTIFMAKVGADKKAYVKKNAQPFLKSYAGREWLFIHSGQIDKEEMKTLHSSDSWFVDPAGDSDSEYLFCYVLGKIKAAGAKTLEGVKGTDLKNWLGAADAFGALNVFISDGQTVVAYRGVNSEEDLFVMRSLSLEDLGPLSFPTLDVNFSDQRDHFRSLILISSNKLDVGQWAQMEKGQLFFCRRAAICWNSHPAQFSSLVRRPLQQSESQKLNGFSAQQEQTQSSYHKNFSKSDPVVNLRSMTQGPAGEPLEYRLFDLNHVTTYTYDQVVESSSHTFRLMPVEDTLQLVERTELHISVPGTKVQFEDVFGNQAIHYTSEKSFRELQIHLKSKLKIYAQPPDDYSAAYRQTTIPLVWMPWQRQMLLPYLLPPELPETQLRELNDYATSFVKRSDSNLIETVRDMNRRIYEDYEYVPGETSFSTTAFDVFTSKRGVCQDFTNLFICLARLLNIPARYRMGYIYTGANYQNKIQSEASHAWVEVYLPYVGWRGFDPTNGCEVGQDHIRVACGRNYRDATPTGGTIFKGGGAESLSVDVKLNLLTN